jgi:SAP domain-containing new25
VALAAKGKLSKSMTLTQFENGYWYQTELKVFAESIGIPSANKLRKDELEKAIVTFLKFGRIQKPTRRNLSRSGARDYEKGLSLKLPIRNYTSNKETKNFIIKEAHKMMPNLKARSGVWYRLNRWREDQLTRGTDITYADLVKRYVELNQTEGAFAKIPHGRYINFISEFLTYEKGATRKEAISAWKKLKETDVPKSYRSWIKSFTKRA